MTLNFNEQAEALAKLLKSDLQRMIPEENWIVKSVGNFKIRVTRKTEPCKGCDLYISVSPEHMINEAVMPNKVSMENIEEFFTKKKTTMQDKKLDNIILDKVNQLDVDDNFKKVMASDESRQKIDTVRILGIFMVFSCLSSMMIPISIG